MGQSATVCCSFVYETCDCNVCHDVMPTNDAFLLIGHLECTAISLLNECLITVRLERRLVSDSKIRCAINKCAEVSNALIAATPITITASLLPLKLHLDCIGIVSMQDRLRLIPTVISLPRSTFLSYRSVEYIFRR